jgi:hypothetical protein
MVGRFGSSDLAAITGSGVLLQPGAHRRSMRAGSALMAISRT